MGGGLFGVWKKSSKGFYIFQITDIQVPLDFFSILHLFIRIFWAKQNNLIFFSEGFWRVWYAYNKKYSLFICIFLVITILDFYIIICKILWSIYFIYSMWRKYCIFLAHMHFCYLLIKKKSRMEETWKTFHSPFLKKPRSARSNHVLSRGKVKNTFLVYLFAATHLLHLTIRILFIFLPFLELIS